MSQADPFDPIRKKIEALHGDTGEIRSRLLNCVDAAHRHPADALSLARSIAESIAKRTVGAVGSRAPATLDACLRELEKPETMSRGLVPGEIITMLHKVRTIGNKALHDDLRIPVTPEDVTLVLGDVLRIVRWYFGEFARGPQITPFVGEAADGPSGGVAVGSRLRVFLFTDLANSAGLTRRLGDAAYVRDVLEPHNAIFRGLLAEFPDAREIKHTGDGFMATFCSTGDACLFALRIHRCLRQAEWRHEAPQIRIGIHIGEAVEFRSLDSVRHDLAGDAANMAARVMDLAAPGQTLMTKAAFDGARQSGRVVASACDPRHAQSLELCWLVHGKYQLKGADEPFEICEVGVVGESPLQAPANTDKAKRIGSEHEETGDWRPGPGIEVPHRKQWILERELGEGGFGEVWLARHQRTKEQRVFKFCFDANRLRSFQREMTLFRLIKAHLGDRHDIVRLFEIQLEEPPYFLESEYVPGGNLVEWAARHGGLRAMPLSARIGLLAQMARTVAAAHSLGIIHKDLKPANILMSEEPVHAANPLNPAPPARPRLCDFGIGVLSDRQRLIEHQITEHGFTETLVMDNKSSRTGTRLYSPPEALRGEPATTAGDVYALGVMLYQFVAGDLSRPLGTGWEEDVADEVLRADIQACTHRDPSRRLASAAELAERLETLDARRADRQRRTRVEQSIRRLRRLRIVLTASLAASLVLGSLGILAFVQWRRADENFQEAILRGEQLARERQRADEHAAEANRRKEMLRQNRYESAIKFGQSLWERGQLGDLRRLLADQRPTAEEVALRGFSWHYLSKLARTTPELQVKTAGGTVRGIAYSPDGTVFATLGEDGELTVWQSVGGRRQWRSSLPDHPKSLSGRNRIAFSPTGDRVYAVTDRQLWIWRSESGESLGTIEVPLEGSKSAAVIAVEGKVLIGSVTEAAAFVCVVDVERRKLEARRDFEPYYDQDVALAPDGKTVVFAGATIRVFDMDSGESRARFFFPLEGVARALDVAPDGHRIAAVSEKGGLAVLDTRISEARFAVTAHNGWAYDVRFDGSGSELATVGADGLLQIWNGETGHALRTLKGQEGSLYSVGWSPDRQSVIAGGWNGACYRWHRTADLEVTAAPATRGKVNAVAFAPDGTLYSVGGEPNESDERRRSEVVRWSRGAQPQPEFFQQIAPQTRSWVLIARNQRSLAQVVDDGSVVVWDLERRQVRFRVARSLSSLSAVQFDPSGESIAIGEFSGHDQNPLAREYSGRHAVVLYEVATGRRRASIDGHLGAVGIAFSPDGKMLATRGIKDGTIRLWDLAAMARPGGQPVLRRKLPAKENRGLRLVFSPDGTFLAAPNVDPTSRESSGPVLVWHVPSGRLVASLEDQNECVAFSNDGRFLMTGRRGEPFVKPGQHAVNVWEIARDDSEKVEVRPSQTWSQLSLPVDMIQCMPDGDTVITWEYGARNLRDLSEGRLLVESHRWSLKERPARPREVFSGLDGLNGFHQLSDDGKSLVTATLDGELKQWTVHPSTDDGPWRVTPTATIQSIETGDGRGHTDDVTCCAVSPDGKTLATGSADRSIVFWDIEKRSPRATLRGHTNAVRAIAYSPDGRTLASASGRSSSPDTAQSSEILLWDAATGTQKALIAKRPTGILCLAFSPDGRRLATGELPYRDESGSLRSGQLRLWDVEAGTNHSILEPPADHVDSPVATFGVAFSPDGATLANVGVGGILQLWDVASGKLKEIRTVGAKQISTVAFSPDGKEIATGTPDGAVQIWSAAGGDVLLTFRRHRQDVCSLAFSPNGRVLASASSPASFGWPSICLWRTDDDE